MSKPTRDPTPEEIAAACREIQATWSDRERESRYWKARSDTTTPIIASSHLVSDHGGDEE